MSRQPLSKEELLLDYSKYWYLKQYALNPLSQELMKEPIEPKDALPLQELNRLLEPGYLEREQGWCVMPDGAGYTANYIWMPNVTIEMIDWWFVWHFYAPASVPAGNGNLRYKIWCPQDHIDTGFDDDASRLRTINERIPMRERRYGAKNFIRESMDGGVGGNIMELHSECFDPVAFGFDPVQIQNPANGTIITARTPALQQLLIYHFRPYGEHDVEMRMRVYSGYDFVDGKFIRVPDYKADPQALVGVAQHMLNEYPHLARFLPRLYAEESNKPIEAY